MAWRVQCSDLGCRRVTGVGNIVELLDKYLPNGNAGLFVCPVCKNASGYVEKSFALQEEGEVWEPFLRGAIRLAGSSTDTYQPFVFLVSYAPDGEITDCWFSYYKDLRSSGGVLKFGYGPGGPPVLGHHQTIDLIASLLKLGFVTQTELAKLADAPLDASAS